MMISKIEFSLNKYLAAQMTNIFKLITYLIHTHDGSQICYFVLIDFQILQRKIFVLGFEILLSAW